MCRQPILSKVKGPEATILLLQAYGEKTDDLHGQIIKFFLIEYTRWHIKLRMQLIAMIKKAMGQSLCELIKMV